MYSVNISFLFDLYQYFELQEVTTGKKKINKNKFKNNTNVNIKSHHNKYCCDDICCKNVLSKN